MDGNNHLQGLCEEIRSLRTEQSQLQQDVGSLKNDISNLNTHLWKVLSARHNGGNISGPGENEEGKLDSDVESEAVFELDENAVMEQRE